MTKISRVNVGLDDDIVDDVLLKDPLGLPHYGGEILCVCDVYQLTCQSIDDSINFFFQVQSMARLTILFFFFVMNTLINFLLQWWIHLTHLECIQICGQSIYRNCWVNRLYDCRL